MAESIKSKEYRKAHNLCVQCGAAISRPGDLCEECRTAKKINRVIRDNTRQEQGICVQCKKPRDRESGWLCTACLAKRRITQRKRRGTTQITVKEFADLMEFCITRRQELNISLHQLADLTGIRQLVRYETLKAVPSFDAVLKILAALDIKIHISKTKEQKNDNS